MRMEGFWSDDDDPADRPTSKRDPTIEMGWDDDDHDDDDWDAEDHGREEQQYFEDKEPGLEGSDQDEDDDWD